jgi:hypothetical protein
MGGHMLQGQRHASINIKPDPRAVQYQQFRWFYIVYPVWMLFFAFTQFASHGFNFAAFPLGDKFFCIFILISAILTLALLPYQRRWFQRLELRRQAAARGDTTLLADPQPMSDAYAVPLPVTIKAVPRSSRSTVVLGVVFGVIFAFIAGVIAFLVVSSQYRVVRAGHPSVLHVGILPSVAIIVCAVVILVVLIVVLRRNVYNQQITFTEHGLMQLGPSSQVYSIPWRDARLFARDAPPGIVQINNRLLPSTFQIASENEVVQWYWVRNSKRYKPPFGLSQAEYNQQMQDLLSLITARTGLPLYDLRKQSSAEQ